MTVFSKFVDPANQREDRAWIPLEADLSEHAGSDVEIVLETRGFESSDAAGPRVLGHAHDHDGGATAGRRSWSSTSSTRCAPTTCRSTATPATPRPSSRASRRTPSSSTRRSPRRRGPSPPWPRSSRRSRRHHGCVQFYTPLTRRSSRSRRGCATGDTGRAPWSRTSSSWRKTGTSTRASTSSRLPPRPGAPGRSWTPRSRSSTPGAACPPSSTCTRWTRTRPTCRRPRSIGGSRPTPSRGEPPRSRPTTWCRTTSTGSWASTTGDRLRRPGVRALLRELKERGLYDRATIVFLSDHGEEFLDHGGWVHGHTLFDELVRVPLVVKYPARREAGRRVARQVQLLDVLPTVLTSQGLPVPTAGSRGARSRRASAATGPSGRRSSRRSTASTWRTAPARARRSTCGTSTRRARRSSSTSGAIPGRGEAPTPGRARGRGR